MNVPTLKNVTSTLGENTGGFVLLELCPIEWLAADVVVDAVSRKVLQPLLSLPGYKLLQLKCQVESIKYKEVRKDSRNGPFYETEMSAIVNLDESDKNLQLDTWGLHRLLVVYTDKNGRKKVIGNRLTGMQLLHDIIVEQDAAGKSFFDLGLSYEAEHAASFYEG